MINRREMETIAALRSGLVLNKGSGHASYKEAKTYTREMLLPPMEVNQAAALDRVNGLRWLGQLLGFSVGYTQYRVKWQSGKQSAGQKGFNLACRAIPSGGARYPTQVMIAVNKLPDVASGIYRYNPLRHSLYVLAESQNAEVIFGRDRSADQYHDIIVFFVASFIDNYDKYGDFGYRLGSQDLGVAVGQFMQVADAFACVGEIQFQYDDLEIGKILGLQAEKEAVYAFLGADLAMMEDLIEATDCRMNKVMPECLKRLRAEWRSVEFGLSVLSSAFRDLHSACLNANSHLKVMRKQLSMSGPTVKMPRQNSVRYHAKDLMAVCASRFSPGLGMVTKTLQKHTLSNLLFQASRPSRSDSFSDSEYALEPYLFAFVNHVEGVDRGLYFYDPVDQQLIRISSGDFSGKIQRALHINNVNVSAASAVVHIAGRIDFCVDNFGIRGYRIQQIEIGTMAQKLGLAAGHLGLSTQFILGFNVSDINRLYHTERFGVTVELQVLIGKARQGDVVTLPLY